MEREVRRFAGMTITAILLFALALNTEKKSVMNKIESAAKIRLEERIKAINETKEEKRRTVEEEKTAAIAGIKAYDEYFTTSNDSYIFIFKQKLCDYLPILKQAGYTGRIKECKKELIKNYPKVIEKLDYFIDNNPYENSRTEAYRLKKTIMAEYKSVIANEKSLIN